jgi:putative endonuclease
MSTLPDWYLYLIECADGSLYAGVTTDVERRFQEHLSGKGARYTRSHKPLRLVASCPVGSRSEALRAELALKRLPKAGKIAALTSPKFPAGATFKTAVAGKKAAKKR